MRYFSHEYWMKIALEEAEKALAADELPIGSVIVGGNQLIVRGQTSGIRCGSQVAHGELMALLDASCTLHSATRPIVLYTTLEPCLMCFGAMIQCGIDGVVYGMRANPDGSIFLAEEIQLAGQQIPEVTAGILEQECVEIMRRWAKPVTYPVYPYVQALLKQYKNKYEVLE